MVHCMHGIDYCIHVCMDAPAPRTALSLPVLLWGVCTMRSLSSVDDGKFGALEGACRPTPLEVGGGGNTSDGAEEADGADEGSFDRDCKTAHVIGQYMQSVV